MLLITRQRIEPLQRFVFREQFLPGLFLVLAEIQQFLERMSRSASRPLSVSQRLPVGFNALRRARVNPVGKPLFQRRRHGEAVGIGGGYLFLGRNRREVGGGGMSPAMLPPN